MLKIFFDSSVIFSALYSKTGASYALCLFVQKKSILGIINETVIQEIIRNTDDLKINPNKIHQFIANFNFLVREKIKPKEIKSLLNLIEQKNAHIIAGAKLANCDFLVTLDKKHIDNSKTKKTFPKLKITSPQKLLTKLTEN